MDRIPRVDASIIHVIPQLRLGAGRVVTDTAIEQTRSSSSRRIEVCISTDSDEYWRSDSNLISELAENGIPVRAIGDFFHRRTDLLHGAGARLRSLRESFAGKVIVHAHSAMAAAVGHRANPDALIATCHGWGAARSAEMDLQDSIAYRLCDSVLTYSQYWSNRLRDDLAVADPKVISMGLDLRRFPPVEKENSSHGPCRIVTVCELTHRKGADILLRTMPFIWNQRPQTELHIIGSGDATDELLVLAAQMDPEMKRIVFHGQLANPYVRLAEFDLFVLGSRSDNLPVALIESMLAGVPIVATAVGGVPELIASGGCGRTVTAESVSALAEGICELITLDRAQLSDLGSKGEIHARRRFDVRRTNIEIESAYRRALTENNHKDGTHSRLSESILIS
jgi:glycosyltransferase involved in cell wall biosynthesis